MKCNFLDNGEVDMRLLEQLIVGIRHKAVQEKLLEKGDNLLSLGEALEVARTHEAMLLQMVQLSGTATSTMVNTVDARSKKFEHKLVHDKKTCTYCGKPEHDRSVSPARDVECHRCRKTGHYHKICKSAAKPSEKPKQ